MPKLVSSASSNGFLVNIILALDDDAEVNICKTLLEQEVSVCPFCKKKVELTADNMQIRIDSPLSSTKSVIGADVGYPIVVCNNCQHTIELPMIMMDLTPFKSVTRYLTGLRVAYKNKQKKAGGTGG